MGVCSPSKVSAMQHFHLGFIWAVDISCLGAVIEAQSSVNAVNIFECVCIFCKLTHLLKDVFKVTLKNHANFFKRRRTKWHHFLLGYTLSTCSMHSVALTSSSENFPSAFFTRGTENGTCQQTFCLFTSVTVFT